MDLHRRRLLGLSAAGLAGLAGCATFAVESDDPADLTTSTPNTGTETPTDETSTPINDEDRPAYAEGIPDLDWADVVGLETAPLTLALSPTQYYSDDEAQVILWFAETATEEHPAKIRARLVNQNDFPNTFRLRETPPFGKGSQFSRIPRELNEVYGRHEGGYRVELVLAPTENHDLVENVPKYELADDGTWRLALDSPGGNLPEHVRLEPGEYIDGEYVLVGRPQGVEYGRPTGTYEFGWRDDGFSITAWDTDSPGPDEESRFAGTDLPSLSKESEVAWYHDADESTPSYVLPEREVTDLPAGVRFTFVNHDRESTGCGHWDLYKLVDDEWYHVGPWAQTLECRGLSPGGTVTWTLQAFHGKSIPYYEGRGLSIGHIGGGTYAAVAGYGHATPKSGALLEIDAPEVEITPTDDVTRERDGDTVRLTAPGYGDDNKYTTDATLTATETEREPDQTLVAEQVMQERYHALRNVIVQFEEENGIERVVLRTDDSGVDAIVGYDDSQRRIRVRGTAYELIAEIDEE
ncbi:hypothetical protein [Haloprofundus salinisoli]|uniref:hypothetical protein n=1 Tax=Haloprofundus salinisoli TaxID=2876193 RepID=UPI001CCAC438|nr:hypothetical protein [Haloprofundus salinisoli]